jgi:hypothetical protein
LTAPASVATVPQHADALRGQASAIPLRIALAAIGFRALSAFVGFATTLAFPLDRPQPATMFGAPRPFWDQFTRYDAGWYYQVAQYGYRFVPGGPSAGIDKPGKIAYFPLYPLLMRYAGRLFGRTPGDVYLGGLLVSWLAFAAALVVLFSLARLDLSRGRAQRAVLLTAIFPFSFFFGLVYTESVFLLLTLVAFYGFRTRRWITGGVAGGLATATRVNGILMLVPLAWIAWTHAGDSRRDRVHAALGLALVPVGIAAYSAYVYYLSGRPFEWARSISRWGYHPGGSPWMTLAHLIHQLVTHPYMYLTTDPMALYDTLYGVTALLFAASIPFVWRKFGAAYGLFMLVNLYLPLSSGALEGLGRYCSVLFPAFIWLASIRSRHLYTTVVVVFALFYTLGLALFTTVHPLF